MQRRDFLKLTGATTALSLTHSALAGPSRRISIVVDANDSIASSDPVKRAAGQLRKALLAKGVMCEIVPSHRSKPKAPSFLRLSGRDRLKPPPEKFPPRRRGTHKPGEYPLDPRRPLAERPATSGKFRGAAPEASSTGSSS